MRNVLKGGLRSLIPHREVEDADEAVDRLDDELEAEPKVVRKAASKKKMVGKKRLPTC